MNCGEHLQTIYGHQRAVDDLSFDVRPGRFSRLVTGSVQSLRRLARARRTLTS